jgi:hypothetical protein
VNADTDVRMTAGVEFLCENMSIGSDGLVGKSGRHKSDVHGTEGICAQLRWWLRGTPNSVTGDSAARCPTRSRNDSAATS